MKTTNTERCFVDSNVLVYLISGEIPKAEKADEILTWRPVISVQVLNEFTAVAKRKYQLDWPAIDEVLRLAKATCDIMPVTQAMHELAVSIAKNTRLRIYDACIVAAAEIAGCDLLYTEDLNHGERIGGVTIRNPFA